jgi:twinkle protein
MYSDGHGHCFSCGKYFPAKGVNSTVIDNIYTYEYLPWRGVSKDVMAKYDVSTKIDVEGKPIAIAYPYINDAFKVRLLEEKKFYAKGPISRAGLFGKNKCPAGSSSDIIITEGELDALSAYQMLRGNCAAVSVQSATSALKDCTGDRDYLNSFERIYLCFDGDTPGQQATQAVAALFDFNKVFHVKLGRYKDPNEILQAGNPEDFVSAWRGAGRFLPEGIISGFSAFDNLLESAGIKTGESFPFSTLQELTDGLRTGEIILITALEGVGKTEVLRAIEHNLLRTSTHRVGIIHLEEPKDRVIKGLAGYSLQVPAHLKDCTVSIAEIKTAYRELFKTEDRVHIYSHFGSDDPNIILDTIRFLVAACGCKFIFLDHISMVVSGMATDDERKALDYLITRLGMMVHELDFCLVLVSHVNDAGLTRGSRYISKMANLWLHLDRNITAESNSTRNITTLTIRKNRFTGRTGPAGRLLFDPATFLLKEILPEDMPI